MTTEEGLILEHRETGARYRPVGCLHLFKTLEGAALFRSKGFEYESDWRVLRARVEVVGEVGEDELEAALERVKCDGKDKVAGEAGARAGG